MNPFETLRVFSSQSDFSRIKRVQWKKSLTKYFNFVLDVIDARQKKQLFLGISKNIFLSCIRGRAAAVSFSCNFIYMEGFLCIVNPLFNVNRSSKEAMHRDKYRIDGLPLENYHILLWHWGPPRPPLLDVVIRSNTTFSWVKKSTFWLLFENLI